MDRFAGAVIRRRKAVIALFVLAAIACALIFFVVPVNYNMADYLPPNARSTRAIDVLGNEFSQTIPNANVLIRDVSLVEAMEYKGLLAEIEGVSGVTWLDDVADLKIPLRMQDAELVEQYYKDGDALFMVNIDAEMEIAACAAIRDLIGEGNSISGEAANIDFIQRASLSEVLKAMAIILPLAILIFMVFMDSWLEPLLILCAIGVAVLINMGTNIFFGGVSFLTNSVAPLLQLAVSMDYAVFLMHSFADNREKYENVGDAMKQAMKSSIASISASALTTLFGFLALVFMEFMIGADLGLILAKGIVISFVSVVVFLPALMMCTFKTTDRLRHRPILPSFRNINNVLSKTSIPAVAIVLILILPSFLGQQRTAFIYGAGSSGVGTYLENDKNAIEDIFGTANILVLLVPNGDIVKELDLSKQLDNLDNVSSVISYAQTVGTTIPAGFLSSDITDQFYSDNYARMIVYTDTPNEGDLAFGLVDRINETVGEYYDEFHLAGQSASLYDMRNIVAKDNFRVNLIAIVSIFLVIMLVFKSAMLPVILLITIETGIWINLSIPYFTDTPINFVGFLVLSTVQLGATVDYAILLTNHYVENRKIMPKKESLHNALGSAFKSILVSGITLSLSGFTLNLTSSNSSISDIGLLLGRGTLFSMAMVLCFLPPMLRVFDKLIAKTTLKARFVDK